ncbi:MAG: hypothetical protein HQ507_04110 [Candidatus Marinimicrobia bacterium]|nr:hypothetical protein [Candidatus Neomarinimicrobiota bacterium]
MKYLDLMRIPIRFILSVFLIIGLTQKIQAQVIQFSVHVASSLNASKDQDMDLGTAISGSGLSQVNLGDPGMGIFSITGNEELDVIVTLTAPANLTHTGASADVIPFTLEFAYANRGVNDVNQAVAGTGGTARFQMRQRDSGPAGAPPTPPSAHYTAANETAYIYIYGSMTVGNIDPGTYSGDVDLTITYD